MSLNEAFAALADPTRREVLRLVAKRPRPAGELAKDFPVSRPAVSKHLKVLKEAGLVEVEQVGRTRIYHLRRGGLTEAHEWMEEAGRFWQMALEQFRRHVEEGRR